MWMGWNLYGWMEIVNDVRKRNNWGKFTILFDFLNKLHKFILSSKFFYFFQKIFVVESGFIDLINFQNMNL
jgi:hypothetical protein